MILPELPCQVNFVTIGKKAVTNEMEDAEPENYREGTSTSLSVTTLTGWWLEFGECLS